MRSLNIGATGMLAQQMNVDTISNNIANMSTVGYKKQRANFEDLMYQNIDRPGATSSDVGTLLPSGLQMGSGVKLSSVSRIHTQGIMEITDNELDIAINGDGFFEIQLPSGDSAYTRAGNFERSDEGTIVTPEGYSLMPEITIPDDTTNIEINQNGEVWIKVDGQINMTNIGQIDLVRFSNPAGLESVGSNLYLETESSGSPTTGTPGDQGFGQIKQGVLETSNVDIVSEITRMITAQRAYEMNSKIISTSDDMLNTINSLR